MFFVLRRGRFVFCFPPVIFVVLDVSVLSSFGGKLHIGFVDIRTKLESIVKEREARRIKRREEEEKVFKIPAVWASFKRL